MDMLLYASYDEVVEGPVEFDIDGPRGIDGVFCVACGGADIVEVHVIEQMASGDGVDQ